MPFPRPIDRGGVIRAEWLNDLLAESKASALLPSKGVKVSRLTTGTTVSVELPDEQIITELNGFIESPSDKTYALIAKTSVGGTITTLNIKTVSGTCSATVKIDSTTVTGLNAVSVTSGLTEYTATANNTYTADQRITLVITSSSSPVDLEFTLQL